MTPIATTIFIAAVIGVPDGSSLTVTINRQPVTVQLAEIELPRNQRLLQQSRKALAKLCGERKAEMHPQFTGSDGRIVAQVGCAGKDAAVEQVRLGMAQVDDAHSTNRKLYEAQADARTARRGLWADPKVAAAWERGNR